MRRRFTCSCSGHLKTRFAGIFIKRFVVTYLPSWTNFEKWLFSYDYLDAIPFARASARCWCRCKVNYKRSRVEMMFYSFEIIFVAPAQQLFLIMEPFDEYSRCLRFTSGLWSELFYTTYVTVNYTVCKLFTTKFLVATNFHLRQCVFEPFSEKLLKCKWHLA